MGMYLVPSATIQPNYLLPSRASTPLENLVQLLEARNLHHGGVARKVARRDQVVAEGGVQRVLDDLGGWRVDGLGSGGREARLGGREATAENPAAEVPAVPPVQGMWASAGSLHVLLEMRTLWRAPELLPLSVGAVERAGGRGHA